jgi:hypothetical protein
LIVLEVNGPAQRLQQATTTIAVRAGNQDRTTGENHERTAEFATISHVHRT